MKHLAFFALLFWAAVFAYGVSAQTTGVAATSTAQITQSTTRENGAALALSEIKQNTIYYAVDTAIPLTSTGYIQKPLAAAVQQVAIAGTLSQSITITLTPRTTAYTINFAATTTDVYDLESKPALRSISILVKPAAAPAAPTVTITFACANGACVATQVP